MAKKLTQEDLEFRKFVKKHDGHQQSIADELGISVRALKFRLHTEKHGLWWARFKADRSKRRRKERNRRKNAWRYERREEVFEEHNRAYGGGGYPKGEPDTP